jgi:hypothetical protein
MPKKIIYREGRFEIVPEEEAIAFYTDNEGRKRPIKKYLASEQQSSPQLKGDEKIVIEFISPLINAYKKILGITLDVPLVPVYSSNNTQNQFIYLGVGMDELPRIYVNVRYLKAVLDAIINKTDDLSEISKLIEYNIVHEMTRLKELEELLPTVLDKRLIAQELERSTTYSKAQLTATKITGIGSWEYTKMKNHFLNKHNLLD